MGWTSQNSFLPFLELSDALVPRGNHLPHADLERDRFATLHTRVENCAVQKFTRVVHFNLRATRHYLSLPFIQRFDLEGLKLDEALLNKVFNLLCVFRHSREGVH